MMTRCTTPPSPTPVVRPEEGVERLVPSVTDLLRRVTGAEPLVRGRQGGEVRLSSPLSFSDGVGRGEVIASIFVYRGASRVDLHVDHNRVFAGARGGPSGKRCYLNDFKASVALPPEAAELPPEFVRGVVAGVHAARDAVRRHNHRWPSPWFTIEVTAG